MPASGEFGPDRGILGRSDSHPEVTQCQLYLNPNSCAPVVCNRGAKR
jgi:hypothetical protein